MIRQSLELIKHEIRIIPSFSKNTKVEGNAVEILEQYFFGPGLLHQFSLRCVALLYFIALSDSILLN